MKKMISIRMDTELMEELKHCAAIEGRSVTNLIETILWAWIRSR